MQDKVASQIRTPWKETHLRSADLSSRAAARGSAESTVGSCAGGGVDERDAEEPGDGHEPRIDGWRNQGEEGWERNEFAATHRLLAGLERDGLLKWAKIRARDATATRFVFIFFPSFLVRENIKRKPILPYKPGKLQFKPPDQHTMGCAEECEGGFTKVWLETDG